MRQNDKGKYDLETKLQTWTELNAAQAAAAAADPRVALQRSATQKRRADAKRKFGNKWGCNGGCSHGKDIGFHVTDVDSNNNNHSNGGGNGLMNGVDSTEKVRQVNGNRKKTVEEEEHDADLSSSSGDDAAAFLVVGRGRDGGGSKSGVNSDNDDESDQKSQADRRGKEELLDGFESRSAEKLGDMRDKSSESLDKAMRKLELASRE